MWSNEENGKKVASFPKTIYMCHKKIESIKEYSKNWKRLNPEYTLKLYDDDMCKKFLKEEYSNMHRDIFDFLQDGPIKGDFWRICILYKYGGIYIDSDIEPLVPLRDFIEDDIHFCTSYIDNKSSENPRIYNPHFIVCHKNNKWMKQCIDMYIKYYLSNIPYNYSTYSIVDIFRKAITQIYIYNDGIYLLEGKKYQFLDNVYECGQSKEHNKYKNIKVFNNRYDEYDSINHCFKPFLN